jgi:hypothetical protein
MPADRVPKPMAWPKKKHICAQATARQVDQKSRTASLAIDQIGGGNFSSFPLRSTVYDILF